MPFVLTLYGHATNLFFQRFPYTDQLPSNSVNRLYNDKEGYLWFGSKDGLCRFDGYRIKVIRSSSTNPNRLTNNSIQTIAEDANNRIWIGTLAGVNIIDKKNYSITPLNNKYVGRDKINSIIKDTTGAMWIATVNNSVVRILPNGSSIRFDSKPDSPYYIPGNEAIRLYEDSKARIWALVNNQGIALYHPDKHRFELMPPFYGIKNPYHILEDYSDHFLICTWGGGMYSMDLRRLPDNPFKKLSLLKNGRPIANPEISYSLTKDKKFGYIWVVAFNGLMVMNRKDDNTYNVISSDEMFPEPYYKLFHEIIQDNQGNLWLGSIGDGIFTLNFNNLSLQTNPLTKIKMESGAIPIVIGLCETTDGYIYMALNRYGLYSLNPQTGGIDKVHIPTVESIKSISAMKHLPQRHEIWICEEGNAIIYILNDKLQSAPPSSIKLPVSGATITNLCADKYGNVWIGADNGLYIKTFHNSEITLVKAIPNVTAISEDMDGNVWVGSDKQGVIKYSMNKSGKIIQTTLFNKNAGNLPNNAIQSICCRKNGDVCIGTRIGSIYFYDQKDNTMHDVSRQYGITEEAILDMLEDDAGSLWISTVKKIIRFNPASHITTYYTKNDGITVTSFRQNAAIKLNNGAMLFGGNNGLCAFDPQVAIHKNSIQPKVVISDILVKNQSIFDNEGDKHYNADKKTLVLQNTDNDVSIEFSALNLTSADKIQYAYRLMGSNPGWIYLGNNRHFVNYANLSPGRYTFEVKATDENGQWGNTIASFIIIKKPPFYQTWWAYLFYLIIVGGIVWFLFNRVRLRNELHISRIEKEKSEELAQTKLRYFTNISHDLLTPLTIISLLTDELQAKSPSDTSQIELIRNNTNRLRRLIKQILAFRKIDTGNMKLKVKKGDIVTFVREVCYTNFQPLIKEKNISFAVESPLDNYIGWFDPDKLDKVMYNLLSNAFKFTPSGGSIIVKMNFSVQEAITFVQLSVSDTGEGIHEKDLPNIFSRFYISSSSDQSQSNGIGLSLVRDLLHIHKGEINVISKLNEGSTFTFKFPISEKAYMLEEFDSDNDGASTKIDDIQNSTEHENGTDNVSDEYTACNILVVEDNKELNRIIAGHLKEKFVVHCASNGLQALNLIREHRVDIVISDVMMPEMNGLELCRRLKSDIATSHIAILLLTAKSSSEDQVDYFNAGADAYMPKPFDMKVLEARVYNLMNKRKQATADFRKNRNVNISEMHYSSLDEDFLKNAVITVEKHMDDSKFDFDRFADIMNSSKSTLHRKLKALTDLSPGEFIRNIRLKHACKMLVETNDPISEIAYTLGFNNPKYFSSCFKVEFDMTPREYREAQQKE